jgi:protein SCO1/2
VQLAICEEKPGDKRDFPEDYTAYTVNALKTHFPNVLLVTQDKKAVHFYDDVIKGKTVIIQFMFANCHELCPMTTPNLVKVQKELEKRGIRAVSMISITVDPVHDTPEVLKEYADGFHVQPGWKFLTGKKVDIDLIRRQLGVYDPDANKIAHMNVLTMGSENTGRWFAMEALAKPDDIVNTVMRIVGK